MFNTSDKDYTGCECLVWEGKELFRGFRNFRGFRVIDLAQFYVINDLKKLIFSQQGIIRTNQNLSESLPSNRMLCYMNIVP